MRRHDYYSNDEAGAEAFERARACDYDHGYDYEPGDDYQEPDYLDEPNPDDFADDDDYQEALELHEEAVRRNQRQRDRDERDVATIRAAFPPGTLFTSSQAGTACGTCYHFIRSAFLLLKLNREIKPVEAFDVNTHERCWTF